MGVFLDDLVRVGLHHEEAALPVVNLGEQADVRPHALEYGYIYLNLHHV